MGKEKKEQEKEKAMHGQKRKARSLSGGRGCNGQKKQQNKQQRREFTGEEGSHVVGKEKKKGMNSSDYLLSLLRENKIRIKKNSNTAKSNALLTLIPDKIYGT